MYLCIGNGVTDSDNRQAAKAGCGCLAELTMRTGCGACCGSCVDTAAEMLDKARAEQKPARDNVVEFPRISHAALTPLQRTSPAPFRRIAVPGYAYDSRFVIAAPMGLEWRHHEPRRRAMQGDAQVIKFLNEALYNELTAINQYFLHAKKIGRAHV